ncbi:uncharacterized protein LOC131649251 [Vicia villosa]|uniref:uncharacterized protein LOC131649251 n=1 Tax=Vicia villosa TaxID=3911 RepID=UPI00273CA488|nr:uncharacterized protein LOC131649251 [Vicia villosa]
MVSSSSILLSHFRTNPFLYSHDSFTRVLLLPLFHHASTIDHTANQITNGDVDFVYYVHPSEGPNSVCIQPPLNENALDVWIDLKERFAKTDKVRVSNLRTEINNLKQGNKSVLDYFTELRGLWEELNSHRPIVGVSEIAGSHRVHRDGAANRCDAMRNAREFRLEDQIMQFLTGLNEKFSVVKTQVLLLDPLPSINKVYSMVVQEESNNVSLLGKPDSNSTIDEANTLVNAYDSKKFPAKAFNSHGGASNNKKDGRVCTFCHRTGHTIDVCYRKHGFPSYFTKRQASANASTTADNHTQSMNNNGGEGSHNDSGTSITQEQYAQLISLLQQTNFLPINHPANPSANHISTHIGHTPNEDSGKSFVSTVSCSTYVKPDFWILDSGANDHVCSSLQMFSCYHKIKPINVCLPNGSVVLAKHAGTIQFSPHLQLHNVLFTPEFSLNLVSVSKLCQSTNCNFIFSANDCYIQDVKTKKMIGLANQVEGLYRLKTSIDLITAETSISSISSSKPHADISIPNNCKLIPKQALWHFRLGHLLHDRLSKMAHMYPDIFNDNKAVCDVCHYARHKKPPYNLSHSKASQNFELLHFDIWGPISTNSIHHHKYF